MRRLGRLSLLLTIGCVSAQGNAAKIRITSNQFAVKDCKFLGQVEGDDHWNGGSLGQGIAENNATVYMRNQANALGADTVLMVRSSTNTSGSNQLGEAYRCGPPAPGSAATTEAPKPPAQTTPLPATASATKIMVVVSESEVRGCTFVDAINEALPCPPEYSSATACMAFRALKQGGNTVLTVGAGKVYSCPARP